MTDKNLNMHTAVDASRAYRANKVEAHRLAVALVCRVEGMAGDVGPRDWGSAADMARLRLVLEEVSR